MPSLQSGCYELTWEKCADLPSPMYAISAVVHDKKVYIMAGDAPDNDTLDYVYCYNITTDHWEQLPSPGHYCGRLQIIDDKLTVIGGQSSVTMKVTNKVSTNINNSWTGHFPNLLRVRREPGVVSHSEYIIVAGGWRDTNTINDDIEILNTTQPFQWILTSVLLPEPMWAIYPTISDHMIVIVGYYVAGGKVTNASYRLPVDKVTTSTMSHDTTDQPILWTELPSAPHYDTRTIPSSHPPVIMGGHNFQFVPTSNVTMLDDSSNKWKKVSSLSSPRHSAAVVPINSDAILVLGGSTGGSGVAKSKAHSITTVEKGKATLTQRAAAIPTEDTHCNIQ